MIWYLIKDAGTHSSRMNPERMYVTQVCTLLCEGGIWVNSSGSADNPDDPSDPHVGSYPRLTLSDITSLVEPHFEIIQIRRGQYGNNTGKDFYTWEGVFKKRANQAIHATSA